MTDRSLFKWIHADGYRFVAAFAAVTILLFCFSQTLGWIGVVLTLWCAYFFRNPLRVTPQKKGLVVSPADGKIVAVQEVTPAASLGIGEEKRYRISIFLNVFDVHINRIPCDGTVQNVIYHQGQFLNASFDKASELNERNTIVIETPSHHVLACTQIAGLIARRICCETERNDTVECGKIYGLIRFGSRADIYLPPNVTPMVIEGQRAVGGETVLADLMSESAVLLSGVTH